MTVEIPTTGGRIEARLRPIDHPVRLLSVELGKLGHVVHVLPAMLKMGFRIVECTPGELAIIESFGITLADSPPLVRWSEPHVRSERPHASDPKPRESINSLSEPCP